MLYLKASISATTNNYYFGTWENTFKELYNNHKCSLRNKSREKNTEFSKYVWELKEKDINYLINWNIAMKAKKDVWGSRKCDLWTIKLVAVKLLWQLLVGNCSDTSD